MRRQGTTQKALVSLGKRHYQLLYQKYNLHLRRLFRVLFAQYEN